MYQLKQGNCVRLKEDLPVYQSERNLLKGAKGRVLTVDERGYTIVFESELVPITELTDRDVELDPEASE